MAKGKKFDNDKPRFDLLDPQFLEDTAEVLTEGAEQYGDYNWKQIERERYIAASYRHLNALHKGEVNDPKSGKPHAAHLACNAMFLHWLDT